ncbi:ROK family protein [Paenibacillus sp. tmac-D7]|uniref:ROK family protein n=1 Tax=Paenibacillus sp. tmac-D7 TaxID=2591462 RepID=UPI0011429B5D|nr:ROK family protein [Paenibacillus sp. tmac-D7]
MQAEAIVRLQQETGLAPEGVGIGIGVPGFVDHVTGTSVFAANLGWCGFPLAARLSRVLGGLPVFVNNDVRMYVDGRSDWRRPRLAASF